MQWFSNYGLQIAQTMLALFQMTRAIPTIRVEFIQTEHRLSVPELAPDPALNYGDVQQSL